MTTVTLAGRILLFGGSPDVWDGIRMNLRDPVTWSLITLTDCMFGAGIIPTGLVLTASVAMMVSIAQLTKKQTLIQELYSLENLSRVDVICLDKTGTLTDGTMAVCDVKAFVPMEEVERHARVLMGAAEERNATSEAVYQYFGSEEHPPIREAIPFSSANKYSGVVYSDGKKLLMGAPDYLIDKDDERLSYTVERAEQGNRVIAMTLDGELIAFIAIEDHIRDTAEDTLRFFRQNGVTVKVISGDNPLTVSRIAEKCGIVNADKYISLHGVALEDIPAIAEEYTVFARVSPEQKEALVAALQDKGHKVAMTGDGVNDILALRRSDSSITFAKATDAAKSCSDVVLLDNDFSHLKEVVGEGRRVISNIQKTAVLYLMKSALVFLLAFALVPFAKAQMWFSIENTYMLEAAVIGTGGFLLSLEPIRTPIKGSFLKNITLQSIAAGILVTGAILLPIMLNLLPKYYTGTPFVADENVRSMMTILTLFAGIVVVLSMCIPFNKYRALSLVAILGVAVILGLMLPTAYIGGQATGADMLAYDAAAGQTIFDSQFIKEMFRPMNSPVVRSLVSDLNNYLVLRLFLYVSVPIFILVHFAAENYARKDVKDVKKNRAFRIGRRLMLSAGFVLMMHATLSLVELTVVARQVYTTITPTLAINLSIALAIFVALMDLAIGVIGYKVWKDPTHKMVRVGFISGIVLLILTVFSVIFSAVIVFDNDTLYDFDLIVILGFAATYAIGAFIVYGNRRLALDKPRDK